jgi:hypothetical protein
VPRDAATEHLMSRKETGDHLRAGTVPVTEVRTGIIVGAGGPDYFSYEAMMRQFGEVVGRRPRILRVPVLSPRRPTSGAS